MTIPASMPARAVYTGDGVTVNFPVPFVFFANIDGKKQIKVVLADVDGENETVLRENTDFTTSPAGKVNGTLTMLTAPAVGEKLTILYNIPIEQLTDYKEFGRLPSESIEAALDKQTAILKQIQEEINRCLKVEISGNQTPEELLKEIYAKLDSATEIAAEAIKAAGEATTAANNATEAVESAEQTLAEVTFYVNAAKIDINNTKTAAEAEITATKTAAETSITATKTVAETSITATKDTAISTINTTVTEANATINQYVEDAEAEVRQIARNEAEAAISDAAEEATATAKANVNSYVNTTILPPLQNYVDSAKSDANSATASMNKAVLSATAASEYASNAAADATNASESATHAATSAENSRIWADGTDSEVSGLGGVHSAKVWSETAQAVLAGKADDSNVLHKNGNEAKYNDLEIVGNLVVDKIIEGRQQVQVKNMNLIYSETPQTSTNTTVYFLDKNNDLMGSCEHISQNDGTRYIMTQVRKADGSFMTQPFRTGFFGTGGEFALGPTPAIQSYDEHLATTKFVRDLLNIGAFADWDTVSGHWVRFKNGFIIQMGNNPVGVVTLPRPFGDTNYFVTFGQSNAGEHNINTTVINKTTTTFQIGRGYESNWVAFGWGY